MKFVVLPLIFLAIAVRLASHLADREAAWSDCHRHTQSQPVVFTAEASGEGGRYRLAVETDSALPWLPPTLSVSPLGKAAAVAPEIGRRYRVSGRLFCRPPHRNPSLFPKTDFQENPSWHFQMAGITPEVGQPPFRTRLLNWFFEPLSGWPHLHALAQATWTGETFFESPAVIQFFRDGGLLAILALSGEHVAIFLVGVEAVATGFFGVLFAHFTVGRTARGLRLFAQAWRKFRVFGGASLLLWTSGGLPSMKRTWWMALFYCLLKCRTLRTSPLQWLASSFAFVLAWDPSLALSPGFLLSAWGTFALFQVSEIGIKKTWAAVALFSFLVPLFTLPWTAHLFSKVAVLGVLLGGVASALWAALFLPVGFLAPLAAHGLPAPLFLLTASALERFLIQFQGGLYGLLPRVRETSFSTLRPTLGECLAIEVLLIVLCVTVVHFLASKRWFIARNSR